MSEKITAKQQAVLDCIKESILNKGFPPSVREICETVGLKSTSSVHAHLETLEKKGYIRRDAAKSRTIEILDDSFSQVRTEMVSIPRWQRASPFLLSRISMATSPFPPT